jgi:hypothetical protein
MNLPEVLAKITAALDRSGIAYMLSGSFASAYYGAPRSTQDIDIVIAVTPPQLRAFVQSLPSDEYYVDLEAALEAHKHESLFNVVDLATGWKIDFIIRKSRAFSQEEFSRRRLLDFHGIPLFVASAEDIVLAKLEWSKLAQSRRQVEDVAAILRVRFESLDHTYLAQWIDGLGVRKEWNDAQRVAGLSDPA